MASSTSSDDGNSSTSTTSDSSTKRISLTSQTPQELFKEADALFERNSSLQEEVKELQAVVQEKQTRANQFEAIARLLQEMANDGRKSLEKAYEQMKEQQAEDIDLYVQLPENRATLDQWQLAVEEGRTTPENIERFRRKILAYAKPTEDAIHTPNKRKTTEDISKPSKIPRTQSNLERLRSFNLPKFLSPHRSTTRLHRDGATIDSDEMHHNDQEDVDDESFASDDETNTSDAASNASDESTNIHSDTLDIGVAGSRHSSTEDEQIVNYRAPRVLPLVNQDAIIKYHGSGCLDAAERAVVKQEDCHSDSEERKMLYPMVGGLTDQQVTILMQFYHIARGSPTNARTWLQYQYDNTPKEYKLWRAINSVMDRSKVILFCWKEFPRRTDGLRQLLLCYGDVREILTRTGSSKRPRIHMISFEDESSCSRIVEAAHEGKFASSDVVAWKPVL